MKNNKLLVVGHVAKDIVKSGLGVNEFWGGAGYHVVMAASMYLSEGVALINSMVGNDFDKKIFENNGIDTKLLTVNGGVLSDRHFLDETGLLRQYYAEGELSKLVKMDDLREVLEGVSWIHLASSPPEQQLGWLTQIRKYKTRELTISCDTFETFARETPDLVGQVFLESDVCFLNEVEWDLVKGENYKTKMVRKLGPLGAEIYDNGKRMVKVGTTVVDKVIDTTGAGDVVAGVYIARKMAGWDDQKALGEACITATKSVLGFGTDGLRETRAVV